ncbi:Uma2 family endonuclease [Spirosoma panaciterrae]|uniref:Uma2 family endonuclease n=1 Tax=Spirosoma panaciterrae TaxID=496058 RepID=UPI000374CF19|nr:Uma2 family endonuclease [Spirosoma panaciterrae]
MTGIVFPFPIEPGIDLFEQMRHRTADEFYYFCQENADYKFERDATGNILPLGQTGGETGIHNSELTTDLTIWNRTACLGLAFDSSTGFNLPNGATRSPDVAWVSHDQWNRISPDERKKFPPLCPDFVVELLSESDTLKGTTDKMREYMDNGCRLAWMIDPKTEEVRIYRADGSVSVVHGFDNSLSGEDVLPGFAFNLQLLR